MQDSQALQGPTDDSQALQGPTNDSQKNLFRLRLQGPAVHP